MATDDTVPAHYQERAHYKECIVYQVYPASFQDSTANGTGDIRGVISRLDYLKDLGVDVIWLSPVYQSPFVDNGYDISSYTEINPKFGTLADVDALFAEVHRRGMKIVMDLVVNHTSEEHPWFQESRKSKDNPYRDWYWWRPPLYDENGDRQPPNNWRNEFSSTSAWEWDETTEEYYLHIWAKEQPDLNWECKDMRFAVYNDIMKWWLDRGCDGFRMDVINLISKDPRLPDARIQDPGERFQWPYDHCANGPRVHEFLQEMHKNVLSHYPGIVTVGETPYTHHDFDVLVPYVLPQNKELQTIFQFEQQEVDGYPPMVYQPWKLSDFKAVTAQWQVGMQERGGWNSIFLENHDSARSVSRFGDTSAPELRSLSAKCLAVMQCTLSGTLYIYQGEEIGMTNLPADWGIEEYKDIMSQEYYAEEKDKDTATVDDMWTNLRRKARDHARSPMQWSDGKHAGFSNGDQTWMRVNEDYAEWNVARQQEDQASVLSFWKQMVAFRKEHLACTYGVFTHVWPDDERVFAYTKAFGNQTLFVALNFTKDTVSTKEIPKLGRTVDLVSNYPVEARKELVQHGKLQLPPWAAVVLVTE